jgi:mRNA interferase MazF
MKKEIKRGQIYYCDLSPVVGSEQGGYRPCLIIQNDVGNKYSPTTIVAIITSRETKAKLPTHYWIESNLPLPSMVELEQIRTIDKQRLKEYIDELDSEQMKGIERALKISLGL